MATKYKCIYKGNEHYTNVCPFHNKGVCNNSAFCENQKITLWTRIKNYFK